MFSIFYFRKSSLSLIKKMIYYIPSPLLEDICNQSGASTGVSFASSLTEVLATVLDHEVIYLALKAPIRTAADDKFCDIFPNFRKNKV